MDFLFVNTGDLVRAIGRTLAHSLWEGMLLAVAAGVALIFTRRSGAGLRYNVLVGLLLLFLVGVGYTFFLELDPAGSALPAFKTGEIPADPNVTAYHPVASPALNTWSALCAGYLDQVSDFLNRHALLIVVSWLVLLALKSVKIVLDLSYIRRIRYAGIQKAPGFWAEKLKVLSRRMGIRKSVQLLESSRIQTPLVLGVLQPVIMLPLGMMAQLPPGQLEAILLHELAHIYRKDYLVNLLQYLAETVFLFNPAVFWVSSLIREEREHCCDDLAVSSSASKADYLQALLSTAEFALTRPGYTMAFQGEKGQLLHRVRRILEHGNTKTLSYMEKISLILCLSVFGVLALLPSDQMQAQSGTPDKSARIVTVQVEGDSMATGIQHVVAKDDKGKVYEFRKQDKKVIGLSVDNQVVPADQFKQYDWLVKTVDEQIAADMQDAIADKAVAEQDRQDALRDSEQAKRDAEQAQLDKEQAERDLQQAQKDAIQAAKDAEQAGRDAEVAKLDAKMSKSDRLQAIEDAKQAKLDAEQAARDAQQAKRDAEQAARDAEQAKLDAEQAAREVENAKKEQELLDEMTSDLIQDKIISGKSDLKSLEMRDNALLINGLKQPDAIFRKYKDKYANRAPAGDGH